MFGRNRMKWINEMNEGSLSLTITMSRKRLRASASPW